MQDVDFSDVARLMPAIAVRTQSALSLYDLYRHEFGDAWASCHATVGEGGAPVEDKSKKPDPTTGLTPMQAKTVEEREANRASRERITNCLIASRERIAAVSEQIRREQMQITRERDAATRQREEVKLRGNFPGWGRKLTHDAIMTKFNQLKQSHPDITLERVVDEAIAQGYGVEQ